MNKQRNNYWKKADTTRECSCGKSLKRKKRVNYPFGKKSTPVITKFYKCTNCDKTLKPLVREAKKLV